LFIGTVPIGPIIITFGFTPEVEFSISAAIAAELKLKLETGALMKYENGKFSSLISGDLAPSVDLTDKGGLALEAEAKVGIMPQFDARIFDVAGPVIAPEPYFKIKGKHELGSEEACATGKIGADLWLKGVLDLFVVKFETKTSFHLIEWEFWKECWDFSENNDNDAVEDTDNDNINPDQDSLINDTDINDTDINDTDINDCTPGQVQTIICVTDSAKLQRQICDENGYWQNDGACYEKPESVIFCTNQTKCYNNSSEMTCPTKGEDFYGQDAQYSSIIGCIPQSYTISGTEPEEIVIDNNTGLEWQRTLPTIFSGCTGGTPVGSKCQWQEAINYCDGLSYDGHSDWRLPTVTELATLNYYGRYKPTIDTSVFPSTGSWYWSSSSYVYNTDQAWHVNFYDGTADFKGETGNGDKTDNFLVRCVMGEEYKPKSSSFTKETNAGKVIVTDTTTNLQWTKEYASKIIWQQALEHCETLDYGGYTDWRLPNFNELRTLLNRNRDYPTSDFPDMPTTSFWSSSSTSADRALSVNFNSGFESDYRKTLNIQNARCVR
jgi:hypothetical protein